MPAPTTPIFSSEIILGDRSKEQYLLLAVYVIRTLGWQVTNVEATRIHAFTEKDGEIFDVRLVHGHMAISSKSIAPLVVNEAGNRENLAMFQQAFESRLGEQATYNQLQIEPVVQKAMEENVVAEPVKKSSNVGWWRLVIPTTNFLITPLICDVCILVFLLMFVSGAGFFDPSPKALISWGSNFSPLTLGGEWWRLVTSVFVHVGVFHLVLNLFGLVFVGIFLEPILGPWRYLAAYIVTGLLASLTSLWWHTLILSAGASGAIFGLYGVFLALLASDLIDKNFRKDGLIYFGVIIVFNLVSGLKEGIDNAAHVGGLVSGFVIGYLYYPSLKMPETRWLKYTSPALVLLLGSGITYYAMQHIPNYMAIYDAKIKTFGDNERQALKVLAIPDSTTRNFQLYELDHEGIQLWQQNQRILDELDKIPRLPILYQNDLKELRKYTTLNEHDYQLRYKKVKEETYKYDDSIAKLDHQIEALVKASNAADSIGKK